MPFLLQDHAIQIEECRGNILKAHKHNVRLTNQKERQSIRRRHVSEEHRGGPLLEGS